ncbi:MAG: T9SS type A sorting domain-containing protein [bacterium]
MKTKVSAISFLALYIIFSNFALIAQQVKSSPYFTEESKEYPFYKQRLEIMEAHHPSQSKVSMFDNKKLKANPSPDAEKGHHNLVHYLTEYLEHLEWISKYQANYTYFENLHIKEIVSQTMVGKGWENSSKLVYFYNPDTWVSESFEFYAWQEGAWALVFKDTYYYDEFGVPSYTIYEYFYGEYHNTSKSVYTYELIGGEKLLVDEFEYMWNEITSEWENSDWWHSSYNDQHLLFQEIYSIWSVDASAWINDSQHSYYYDGYGNLLTSLYDVFDTGVIYHVSSNDWIYVTINNNHHPVNRVGKDWNGDAYINSDMTEYSWSDHSGTVLNDYEMNSEWIAKGWNYTDGYWNEYFWEDSPPRDIQYFRVWQEGKAWKDSVKYTFTYMETTGINDGFSIIPGEYSLANYPNPFNPRTTIKFHLPERAVVTLKIYDISGQLIKTLFQGKECESGTYDIDWDGRDNLNSIVASGVYLYRLETDKKTITNKCMFQK